MDTKFKTALKVLFESDEFFSLIQKNFDPCDIFDDDQISEYVAENLDADDVYDCAYLDEWWRDHNDPWDCIDEDDLISYACDRFTALEIYGEEHMRDLLEEIFHDEIFESCVENLRENYAPEEVFEEDELEEWARDNGFVKLEECPEPAPSPQPGHIE